MNNRSNAPSPKTIKAANNEKNYKLTGAATLPNQVELCFYKALFLVISNALLFSTGYFVGTDETFLLLVVPWMYKSILIFIL